MMILMLVLYLAGLGTPDPPMYRAKLVTVPSMDKCITTKAEIEAVEMPSGEDILVFCIDLTKT